MTNLAKYDQNGKAFILQGFIWLKSISILLHKLDTLSYHENKLVGYDWFGIKSTS